MKTKLLLLVLALQTAWVLGTVITQERVLRLGQLVQLETRPVDPRDLLRGDFVILNYEISDVSGSLFSPPLTSRMPSGQEVYVALSRKGEFHEAIRASIYPIEARGGEVVIRGRVNPNRWSGAQTNSVHLEYNLERYYVSEGTGNPRGKVTVQAAVSKAGIATIKQVLVDGKPYAEAMKDNGR